MNGRNFLLIMMSYLFHEKEKRLNDITSKLHLEFSDDIQNKEIHVLVDFQTAERR